VANHNATDPADDDETDIWYQILEHHIIKGPSLMPSLIRPWKACGAPARPTSAAPIVASYARPARSGSPRYATYRRPRWRDRKSPSAHAAHLTCRMRQFH
jgi:hypothetical protein